MFNPLTFSPVVGGKYYVPKRQVLDGQIRRDVCCMPFESKAGSCYFDNLQLMKRGREIESYLLYTCVCRPTNSISSASFTL